MLDNTGRHPGKGTTAYSNFFYAMQTCGFSIIDTVVTTMVSEPVDLSDK